MSLNESQIEAINYISGPCLVLAGAGSGKTKVIVNKIIHLIKVCNYDPKEILAITFTNKAAYEMQNRVLNLLPLSLKCIYETNISTFHALGLKIIKSELKLLKLKPNFSIFDKYNQIKVLQEIISKKDNIFLKKVQNVISNWKNRLLRPHEVKNFYYSCQDIEFANYYKLYDSYLKKFNILDFDDLIFLPTLLLKNYPESRNRWNTKIKYLLVDEYQDTNFIQYELIKLLSNKKSNFTFVGDDNQAIYSWRGANINNFLLLKKDYDCLRIITMKRNYRSSGRILKIANKLIQNNLIFFEKELFSNFNYGPVIEIISAKNESDEAKKVLARIMLHKLTNNTQYKDYAILYRSNYQVKIFEKFLIQFKIPYQILENKSFFSLSEIKDLVSYLRLIINPNDDIAFLRIINKPLRGIGLITVNKLKKFAKFKQKSLFIVSSSIDLESIVSKRIFKRLQEFVFLIKNISLQLQSDPFRTLQEFLVKTRYLEWLTKRYDNLNLRNQSINNVLIFLNWIICEVQKKIVLDKSIINILFEIISDFVVQISLNNDEKHNSNCLQLMTLHASKGLEFLYVFIVGVEEGILPHYRSIIKKHVDEERRLMYVGITRAKKELFFSYSIQRFQYGVLIDTKPSRFLLELPNDDLSWGYNKIFS